MAEDEDKANEYPKYVNHPTAKDPRNAEWPLRVVVKDKKAEEALLSGETETKGKAPKGGWPKNGE